MSDFTAADLERIINDDEVLVKEADSVETVDSSEFWHELEYTAPTSYRANPDKWAFPGIGEIEYVDGETGGEGSAEHIWQVFKVQGRYFRKTGYYASYDGSNWDGSLEEVEPYEKTVVDFRKVK